MKNPVSTASRLADSKRNNDLEISIAAAWRKPGLKDVVSHRYDGEPLSQKSTFLKRLHPPGMRLAIPRISCRMRIKLRETGTAQFFIGGLGVALILSTFLPPEPMFTGRHTDELANAFDFARIGK